jgi:3',5'-cyclic AMP phosphodiesterase CpdA
MLHHAPFVTGLAHVDEVGMDGSAALEQVIARHPQVERVLCGHVHRSTQIRFGGTIASSCPSTAHQQALDLRPDGIDSFSLEPPGFQLHRWTGRTLFTHTRNVGTFAGPFPFH